MKKITLLICTLLTAGLSLGVQAHDLRHNRVSGHISYSSPGFYYSPFPSASLIGGISYRNYQSRQNMQYRIMNSRPSANRAYQNGYRDGYRDGSRSAGRISNCYEVYYDRYGNRIRRNLPSSACRH